MKQCFVRLSPALAAAAWLVALTVLLPSTAYAHGAYSTLGDLLHWYSHTAKTHPGTFRFEEMREPGHEHAMLPVVTISNFSVPESTKPHAVLVFGEHARELITCELGLWLSRALAGDTAELLSWAETEPAFADIGVPKDQIAPTIQRWVGNILNHLILKVLPVENVDGRQAWEGGNLCLRKTAHGVDLNRNYPFAFAHEPLNSEMFGGAHPFSEPQSRMIARLALSGGVPAKAYLNVHSGEWAAYSGWDSKGAVGPGLPADLADLFEKTEAGCHCIVGPAGAASNYLAYGTGMDFMYTQLGVPYALTYELYGSGNAGRLAAGAKNKRLFDYPYTTDPGIATVVPKLEELFQRHRSGGQHARHQQHQRKRQRQQQQVPGGGGDGALGAAAAAAAASRAGLAASGGVGVHGGSLLASGALGSSAGALGGLRGWPGGGRGMGGEGGVRRRKRRMRMARRGEGLTGPGAGRRMLAEEGEDEDWAEEGAGDEVWGLGADGLGSGVGLAEQGRSLQEVEQGREGKLEGEQLQGQGQGQQEGGLPVLVGGRSLRAERVVDVEDGEGSRGGAGGSEELAGLEGGTRALLAGEATEEEGTILKMVRSRSWSEQNCFSVFNPAPGPAYRDVVARWVAIFLYTLDHIANPQHPLPPPNPLPGTVLAGWTPSGPVGSAGSAGASGAAAAAGSASIGRRRLRAVEVEEEGQAAEGAVAGEGETELEEAGGAEASGKEAGSGAGAGDGGRYGTAGFEERVAQQDARYGYSGYVVDPVLQRQSLVVLTALCCLGALFVPLWLLSTRPDRGGGGPAGGQGGAARGPQRTLSATRD